MRVWGSRRLRYDDRTPRQLSWAMRRTWLDHPLDERIIEDRTRYPLVIDKIVEAKGGVVSRTCASSTPVTARASARRPQGDREHSQIYVSSPP